MADKISSYGRPGLDINQSRHRSVARTDAGGDSKPSAVGQGAPKIDGVDFSATVTNLKRIESGLKELPEVDQRRVEDLRQRVESGDFRVDTHKIAANLLRFERELG